MKKAHLRSLPAINEVDLSTNENPLGPSPRAAQALTAVLWDTERYPDQNCTRAEARIARMHGVPAPQVLLGPGASGVLRMASEAVLTPGCEAIVATPGFPLYRTLIERRGGTPICVPLTADYRHDLQAMARALSPRTRAVFICNPNNPTGQPVSREELEAFMRQVPEQVLVIIDEAYYEYSSGPQHAEALDWVRQGAHALVVRSFSKAYGLAGLRAGYGVGPEELISTLRQVRDPYCVSSLAQVAVIAALEDKAHLAAVRALNEKARAELCRAMEQLGLDFIPSCTNFVMVRCGGDDEQLAALLLEQGVRVSMGSPYGMPGWLRVTTGTVHHIHRFANTLQALLHERE